ncbi:Mgm101p-domain-containing protein [Xylona heveae TC161]|uniref:Mitochondrial genome maintenance protein MGM101 n=1 Tax=Xylona heveae (strain CBS 132557 / TC161) TaxID=1328760 RepID=A0A165GYM2_XYLHT|nr:Mgm101p-domain-containing protein [Xylona heveae TC161]KZF22767.1 Mgm101p-domain-containing protein [Xylona heveae TC161]
MASSTFSRPGSFLCKQLSSARIARSLSTSSLSFRSPTSPQWRAVAVPSNESSSNTTRQWSRCLVTTTRQRRAAQGSQAEANAAAPSPADDAVASQSIETQNLTNGLGDEPLILDEGNRQVDWSRSFHGLSSEPFPKETADTLLQEIHPDDIEVKPDGIIYLPEIKYRRILNKAFGPGGWGLAPRGETIVTPKSVTREYALVAHGRLVSVARGEQDYFSPEGIPTATEGCKSNALMRCCKDLGVASELWDPRFIRKFMSQHAKEIFVEHVPSKRKRKIWLRKDDQVRYPYKETKGFGA